MTLFKPFSDIAVVSGAGGDIGSEIAAELGRLGCTVILLDISETRVDKVAEALNAQGLRAHGYAADLSMESKVEELRDDITAAHGPAGILVNALGIVSSAHFLSLTGTEWERTMEVNLASVFSICKAFLPGMDQSGGGRIINIASAAGKTGGGLLGTAAYVASKAGVIGFTKALAREMASRAITCNSIAPGPIDTSMTKIYREQPELRAQVEASLPMRRIGTVSEVANAVAFLSTVEAGYITGETFDIDGGLIME